MNQRTKKGLGDLVKTARAGKGYTQQELSDLTGISLRSIQRIEGDEVLPRSYTVRILAEHLDLEAMDVIHHHTLSEASTSVSTASPALPVPLNRAQKIILSAGTGLFLTMGGLAFLIQAPTFPETLFEGMLFWMGVAGAYTLILYRLWR